MKLAFRTLPRLIYTRYAPDREMLYDLKQDAP
jgi:hypothetical protein